MVKASLIPAVGYIRMSSDAQEDSPDRQRAEITALAKRLGYTIIRWYEDHGLTGTESANRPEFQKLLAAAGSGEFEAVLLYEQSRFSREDIFDVMIHWRLLRDVGVKLVTCQRGVMGFDDLGDIITAIVDQHGARDESLKIADRTVSGKLHAVRNGRRVSGMPLFGFDKQIRDETGLVVQRVHFRDSFRKPNHWTISIVPSDDTAAVEAIQWAFASMQTGSSSM